MISQKSDLSLNAPIFTPTCAASTELPSNISYCLLNNYIYLFLFGLRYSIRAEMKPRDGHLALAGETDANFLEIKLLIYIETNLIS